jgi:hypothetical protein
MISAWQLRAVVLVLALGAWRAAGQDCAYLYTSSTPGTGAFNGTWLLRAGRGSVRTADTVASACAPEAAAAQPGLRLQGAVALAPTSGITLYIDSGRVNEKGAPQDSVLLPEQPKSQCASEWPGLIVGDERRACGPLHTPMGLVPRLVA